MAPSPEPLGPSMATMGQALRSGHPDRPPPERFDAPKARGTCRVHELRETGRPYQGRSPWPRWARAPSKPQPRTPHGDAAIAAAVGSCRLRARRTAERRPSGSRVMPRRRSRPCACCATWPRAGHLGDAQLRGPHEPGPRRSQARRGDEEHRKLIDGRRNERLWHRDAVQGAAVNLDVGDRLWVRPLDIGVRAQADVRSHAPQQLQQSGTRRVHADGGQREWTIGLRGTTSPCKTPPCEKFAKYSLFGRCALSGLAFHRDVGKALARHSRILEGAEHAFMRSREGAGLNYAQCGRSRRASASRDSVDFHPRAATGRSVVNDS